MLSKVAFRGNWPWQGLQRGSFDDLFYAPHFLPCAFCTFVGLFAATAASRQGLVSSCIILHKTYTPANKLD